MSKYIRLSGDTVVEVLETEYKIEDLFHPSLNWQSCNIPTVDVGYTCKDGSWLPPVVQDFSAITERYWRNAELVRADEELNKVQDADPKAIGTVGQWREYRKALRNYPSVEGFPNETLRPVSPA